MSKMNPLKQSNQQEFTKESLPERVNPHTDMSRFKRPEDRYKTIRVHKEDFKYLKAHAFYNDIGIIDAVSKAVQLLKEQELSKENGNENLKANHN